MNIQHQRQKSDNLQQCHEQKLDLSFNYCPSIKVNKKIYEQLINQTQNKYQQKEPEYGQQEIAVPDFGQQVKTVQKAKKEEKSISEILAQDIANQQQQYETNSTLLLKKISLYQEQKLFQQIHINKQFKMINDYKELIQKQGHDAIYEELIQECRRLQQRIFDKEIQIQEYQKSQELVEKYTNQFETENLILQKKIDQQKLY